MNEKFFYPLTILEHHLDTFGHVNNAIYFELYEEARWDLITKNGYGLSVIKELKQGPIILEVKCRFLKELRLRDCITIESVCTELRRAASTISQRIVGANGELYSDAEFKFALFDTERRKIIPPTDKWIKAMGVRETV